MLTASIAQEIEEDGNKTGIRKEAANVNEETRERRKGEEGRSLTSAFNEAMIETSMSCLEDDNECMVYVSYILAWARPL